VLNLFYLLNSRTCGTAPGSFCRLKRSVPYQFHPVSELQKMQYPGDAALDMDFGDVQPVGDLTITEALTDQAKERAQDSYFFPKDTHRDLLDTQ
jgi:hypothetical protein